jgi:hypothetical protein
LESEEARRKVLRFLRIRQALLLGKDARLVKNAAKSCAELTVAKPWANDMPFI